MSQTATDHTIAVYSDYVCPFCYLGKASLEEYLADHEDPPAVDWRPFDLRSQKRGADGTIDETIDDGKDDAYFEQARENVQRLKDEYDVEMTLDLSRDVDSWNAQQAALFVREDCGEAPFQAFHDAVFDALWQDGRDIGDPNVLAEIAEAVDLDGEVIRAATETDKWEQRLRELFGETRAKGITGVPTFVYGDHAARGAVPPAQLRRLVEGV